MSSADSDNTQTRILKETWRLMEQHHGLGVRVSDVAKAAGVSRQAVYLHYPSRAELLIATVRYVDEINHLNERLSTFLKANNGLEALDAYVNFWGNYIPKIFGLAKALMSVRDIDQAAAVAWKDRMEALHQGCAIVINCLQRDHLLIDDMTPDDAIDVMWSMLSIAIWENLTIDCGWSNSRYIRWLQAGMKQLFIKRA